MACIKGVNRSACAAFAPEGAYLAAGTMAGAVDLQFSSSANLDIFELDFASDDREMVLAGSAPSSERFNRLSWGKGPSNSEEFSLGLIAGGLVDGNIGLWNPKPLISAQSGNRSSEEIEGAFLSQLSRHKGPVRGLEFNTLSPNLIASGADEGDICIWDVTNPTEPTHFPPLRGSSSATQGEISFLSWNYKTQHILASTSYNGTTVVWDLRRQKPVLSFADSARRRCSVLQWNPDLATQLIVASDEDSSPSLRLWDLRNSMSPNKEFVGHTKGVIAMSWCPIDTSYVLTCAKDNRTICWDVVVGETVSELPAGTNWNFDVHWYPRIPGVISASSFDGKIGIYNIEGCGRYGTAEGDLGTAPLRAPKWYKRKAGVSFGFGGKLVSFNSSDTPAGSSEVYVHSLVTEQSLASRSSEFQTAIKDGERTSLRLLCEKKSQESESKDEREIWDFLTVMLGDDRTARSELLSHLGFSPLSEETDAVENHISEQVNSLDLNESGKDGYASSREAVMFALDNGEDFFNNLPSPRADTPVSTSESKFITANSVPVEEVSQQQPEEQQDFDDLSLDDAVQRALVVGDYKGAVAQCISAGRMADALIIAHAGGSALWESTRDKYLKASHSPYLKVVAAMVTKDLTSLVNTRPLKSWKETLALLCSFAQPDEWTLLCDTLASRLLAAGSTLPATLCFMCAGNIDKTVEIWSRMLAGEHSGKSYVELLQDLMEKTIVLALATGKKQFSTSVYMLIERYAEILASQGLLSTAMEYLKLLGTEESSPELRVLQDRIALSIEPDKNIHQSEPGPVHGVDQFSYGGVDSSRSYYPEQLQTSVLNSSPYTDNNYGQPSSSFPRGYPAASTYQPQQPSIQQPSIQQPNMFVPSQVPQFPQGNFAPPPVNTQPPLRPFVPSDTPMLRNVERYQQPTLGSQLYPEPANPNYQVGPQVGGPPAVQRMPQVVAPSPASRGFVPMSNSGIQRPGMSQIQPSSPNQAAAVQTPVTPAAPPPTIQTADTSKVPAEQRAVITTLTRLFNETSEAAGGARANPLKRREIEDSSRKLGALFVKLNSGDISKNAAEKLIQLCQALDNGDFSTALQIQVLLTTSDWDECNFWLATLKRMIKARQGGR